MRIPKLILTLSCICMITAGFAADSVHLDNALIEFDATRIQDRTEIRWVSKTSYRYIIEKSLDGEVWQELIEVKGTLNHTSKVEYFDIDMDVPNSRVFYRIMRFNENNEALYSRIAFVPAVNDLMFLNQAKTIKTLPSALAAGTKIDLPFATHSKKGLVLVLRNTSGKEYYAKVVYMGAKSEYLVDDASGELPEGSYIITATSREEANNAPN